MKLRFWDRRPSAEERLDQANLDMLETAMTLERKRKKGRIYEV